MAERIAVLEVIPVVPAVLAFGGQKIMQRSWDGGVAYQTPYAAALLAGQGGKPLTDQEDVVVAPLAIVGEGIKTALYGKVEQARIALLQGGAVRTVPIVEESDIGLERIGP